MADLNEMRAAAQAKKDEARQKIESAKQAAKQAKALKAKPLPKYVEVLEPTGNAELDSAADLDAVQEGFRKRAKDEGKRFALATDTEYWACLCFQTREQKEAFLSALNILSLGDKYLDGQEVAKVLGVKIPGADVPYNTSSKRDKAWEEFT